MTGFQIAMSVVAVVVGVGGILTDSWAVAGSMSLVLLANLWPGWMQRRSRRKAAQTTQGEPPAA